MLVITESFLSYLNEVRTFDRVVSLGELYYSFPEFQVKDYDGSYIYKYVFEIQFGESTKIKYMDCYGANLSFEDFFEHCSLESQEHIIFHLDFFSGRLKNDC